MFVGLQISRPINPKVVTRNELYGYLHPATREWKEGLVSVTFREMANNTSNKHQWIVLDGDIDAGKADWPANISGPWLTAAYSVNSLVVVLLLLTSNHCAYLEHAHVVLGHVSGGCSCRSMVLTAVCLLHVALQSGLSP